MGNSSCCEKRDEKDVTQRPASFRDGRKLQGINDQFDSVLDNFSQFMREKQKLERERTLRSQAMSADAGGTQDVSGNLSVTSVTVNGLIKHIQTIIKMENVASFQVTYFLQQDTSFMVPSVFFTVPKDHTEVILIFKALKNLMNYTFKRQPSPKISQFFKVKRFKFLKPKESQEKSFDISQEMGFSYDLHRSNFYADTFADYLRVMRAEGLEFIGGICSYNLKTQNYEIQSCFYAPAAKALPYHVEAIPGEVKLEHLQDLLNTRLRNQLMLFRHCVSLYDQSGNVKMHLLVFQCREMPIRNFDFHVTYFPEQYWCEAGHLDQNQLATYLIKEEVINGSILTGVIINNHLTSSYLIFTI